MREKFKKIFRMVAFILAVCGIMISSTATTYAGICSAQKTDVKQEIKAAGSYDNWDGVSNVSQFTDENGEFCFAYDSGKYVYVVKTKDGVPEEKKIKLKKKTSIFGGVTCDEDGYFYVVTGKNNDTDDMSKNTIFISKYDGTGKLIKSIGDNGGSSLASYYGASFHTRYPFDAGNCDIAINGKYLAVNYAREMYSGHQSNSLFLINKDTMKKVHINDYYNSHSFAQRVVPYGDDFLLASEGDCYDRAFTVSTTDVANGSCKSQNTFDFWVKKGTFDRYDMYTLNNNFAHMGGLAASADHNAALVGTSAKSLSSKAKKEKEQLFIQIFNPAKNLGKASGYVTKGKRSGYSGPNGDQKVTNYGVKWLTSYSSKYKISNPQVVATDKGNYVVLFERYKSGKYEGVYYTVLSASGKTKTKITKLSADACLNPCEMPVYTNGMVCWAGNSRSDQDKSIYIYSFKVK